MKEVEYYNCVYKYHGLQEVRDKYVTSATYLPNLLEKEKRNIRRSSKKFFVEEGYLMYIEKQSRPPRRWIVDDEERKRILTSCHSDNLGGHFGRDKTRNKVCSRYYWLKIVEYVDTFTASCDVCQRGAKKLNKNHPSLYLIKVKNEVWHRIGIDLIGPLNETPHGHRYIITCTDYFSKWPEAEPLADKRAEGVEFFLYRLIAPYGVCSIVMTDQGKEFVNSVNKSLFDLCGVD